MVRYTETISPSGVGIREEQLHQGTGLRNASINVNLGVRASTFLISGAAATAQPDSATFVSIKGASWRGHLVYPMTPTLFFAYQSAGTMIIQFRVSGLDQFDNHVVEVTPIITMPSTAATNVILHCSKVFRYVENVEYRSIGMTGMSISVTTLGVIDPTGVEGAGNLDYGFGLSGPTKMIGSWANWGLGTPLRMEPYSTSLPASTQPNFAPTRLQHQIEITGAAAIRLRESTTPTILNAQVNNGFLPIFGDTSAGNTTIRIGQSAGIFNSGGFITDRVWAGTPHKIGFVSSDSWTTGFSKAFTGSSTRASGIPTTAAQLGEDDLQFIFSLRSALGTRRSGSPEPNYPRG
jgi:hypothetical protein